MQINEKLLLEGIEKLQALVEKNKIKDLFTFPLIYIEHKPKEGVEGTKNKIEKVFNDIAKELLLCKEQLTLLYNCYDYCCKNNKPLKPIHLSAYYDIANIYHEEGLFLYKFHNFLEITEDNFLHFLHNNFVLDLMHFNGFLGSSLELHLELLFSFKKLWNDERLYEDKIKLKEESNKILIRYEKIINGVTDFCNNYLVGLCKEIGQFQIEKYLIWHIYIRHIEETQIDESGTCFPKDFDNEKLCNLLITILNKPHFSELGNKNSAVYVYHEEQIYTVVFRGNLIHSFFPYRTKPISNIPDRYKEGGDREIINLNEVLKDLKK